MKPTSSKHKVSPGVPTHPSQNLGLLLVWVPFFANPVSATVLFSVTCDIKVHGLYTIRLSSISERSHEIVFISFAFYPSSIQETILEIVRDAMIKRPDTKGFLIDGFPRELNQAVQFEKEVRKVIFS